MKIYQRFWYKYSYKCKNGIFCGRDFIISSFILKVHQKKAIKPKLASIISKVLTKVY